MHRSIKRWSLVLALTAMDSAAFAQAPQNPVDTPAAKTAKDIPKPVLSRGIPLPPGDTLTIATNTTERYSVAPYKIYDTPRSTRQEVASIEMVRPPGGSDSIKDLPDSFTITTTQLVGV